MAEETITILKVGTDEAVKSVNDLRNNVKVLKESLGDLEIGTQEYQNTLDELKVNQNVCYVLINGRADGVSHRYIAIV